ncbi:hypothetical protein Trydic_g7299 [Trypoxylus dichotomus]
MDEHTAHASVCQERKTLPSAQLLIFQAWRVGFNTQPVRWQRLTDLLIPEEVKSAALNIKSGKAPGPNQIPPETMKIAGSCTIDMIVGVMNSLLKTQKFPEQWQLNPLCLLNTINKFLEILLKNRLLEELKERADFHQHQYGFQKRTSSIQAIQSVVEITKDRSTVTTKMLLAQAVTASLSKNCSIGRSLNTWLGLHQAIPIMEKS